MTAVEKEQVAKDYAKEQGIDVSEGDLKIKVQKKLQL
jgi:hypothetical protein